MMEHDNNIEDYNYHLPEEKIAKFPLDKRDESKLLVYRDGAISETTFHHINSELPENSFLLFNDTRVIAARLIFYKETGARVEVFLLEPLKPHRDVARAMEATRRSTWLCAIGNKKKWKSGTILQKTVSIGKEKITLTASCPDPESNHVDFSWDSPHSFAELIEHSGKVPIPPYLNREDQEIDKHRYQTVYSHFDGAVAAPTAGLHFTEEIIASLSQKNIRHGYVTLHVSAGTFKPVQTQNYTEHDMHREQVIISRATIEQLLQAETVICVGTTALRTLESLYWMGVKMLRGDTQPTFVEKLYPYSSKSRPSKQQALEAALHYLDTANAEALQGTTEIFIFHGYAFRMCQGLITNFHQPKSTLLLLISAFVGADWKKIYEYALGHNFRFLSYGDSSLLIK